MTVAWILAAGLGTRLRPLTLSTPKPLLEVCGRPLIVHALQLLRDAGVRDVAVNSHWLHPAIPTALGASVDVDGGTVHLLFTQEPTVMGTGGGLLGLRHVMPASSGGRDRVLIANADALIDLDVKGLLATSAVPLSTLVLKPVADVANWGAIGTDGDDRIVSFAGRVTPKGPIVKERMFCGWHCVHPKALDVLPAVRVDDDTSPPTVKGDESCINKEGYPRHLDKGAHLAAFAHAGFFFDVGNNERLWEANRALLAGDVALAHLRPFARFNEVGPRQFVHPRAVVKGKLQGPVVVEEGAVIDEGAVVGEFAVVGRGVHVKAGVKIHNAVVQSSARAVDVDAVGVHVAADAAGEEVRAPIAG